MATEHTTIDGYKKIHSNRPVWNAVVHFLSQRDGTLCGICGAELDDKKQIDHIIPRSVGGEDILDNFRLVHGRCNVSHYRKNFKSRPPKPRSEKSKRLSSENMKRIWDEIKSGLRPSFKSGTEAKKISGKKRWDRMTTEQKSAHARKVWITRRANGN